MYLILSSKSDLHARAVEFSASVAGYTVQVHGSFASGLISNSSIWVDGVSSQVTVGNARALRSVWYRRPADPTPPYAVGPDDRKFVLQQWREHVQCIAKVSPISGAFWINRREEAVAAENKAYQLSIAAKLGFSIPRTLISSDPDDVREFVSKVGACIFKAFSAFAWVDSSSGSRSITVTQNITADHIRHDEAIRVAPGIYQEKIEKKHELRVTVIGDRLFAMQVTARKSGVDWRGAVYEGADVQAVVLPGALESRIRQLMSALGLVYGAVDLGVDHGGRIYFFEINQGGQFLHVEEKLPELPLLACFTSMFLQARPDYDVPHDHERMSLSSYRADESYCDWQSEFACAQLEESPHISHVS